MWVSTVHTQGEGKKPSDPGTPWHSWKRDSYCNLTTKLFWGTDGRNNKIRVHSGTSKSLKLFKCSSFDIAAWQWMSADCASSLWYWLCSPPNSPYQSFPPSLFKRKQSPLTVCWATETPPVPALDSKYKKKKLISWSDPNGLSEAQHSLVAWILRFYQLWHNYLWWFFNFLHFSLSRRVSMTIPYICFHLAPDTLNSHMKVVFCELKQLTISCS